MEVAGRDIEVTGDYQISGTVFLLFFLFPSVIFSVFVCTARVKSWQSKEFMNTDRTENCQN
jgi:hypothetical protein